MQSKRQILSDSDRINEAKKQKEEERKAEKKEKTSGQEAAEESSLQTRRKIGGQDALECFERVCAHCVLVQCMRVCICE